MGVRKVIFPTAGFLLNIAKESAFILRPEAGGPIHTVYSFFYHTLVMPAIGTNTDASVPGWFGMVTQLSVPGSGTVFGIYAVFLWTILLALGLWALFSSKIDIKFRVVLAAMLFGQLLFHFFYGFETFLYSLHFIVVLIPLVALSSLTKFRVVVLGILIFLIPCVVINNTLQFAKAVTFVEEHY